MLCRNLSYLIPSIILSALSVKSFEITDISYHPSEVRIGDNVTLQCKTSGHWEYCYWKHGSWKCNLEWKYKHDGVRMQECAGLKDRAKYVGTYDEHECDLMLTGVDAADEGLWECTIESYKLGIIRGTEKKAVIDLKLTKDTGGSRDGPRARSDFGDFVFPGDILTTEATTLDATTSSPNTNIDSSPDPKDITTISLQPLDQDGQTTTENELVPQSTTNTTDLVRWPNNTIESSDTVNANVSESVQPKSTSEMSQASSPGIDILAPAIAGSIILILIAVGVTGFIYKRNKHSDEYIVAKGGTGYNYDGPEEALFTKTANGDSKVDFPGSTLDGMDKNNSEPTKSFIAATATIDSRDQNPQSRAPVSAVFENKA